MVCNILFGKVQKIWAMTCLCDKFYSFMFMHKISIRVVCTSDYHPRSHDLSRWWKKRHMVPSYYINVNRIINAIKYCFLFFLDLIQKVFLHNVFDKIFVNRCSAQVSYWAYANCFNNKVSKGSILLPPCKVIVKIWNRGNFCLWNPESWALKFGVQLKVVGIPLMIWIRNQSSIDKECVIWYLESGIYSVESRIQDCLVLPYMERDSFTLTVLSD